VAASARVLGGLWGGACEGKEEDGGSDGCRAGYRAAELSSPPIFSSPLD
jgi:hypothetical protein